MALVSMVVYDPPSEPRTTLMYDALCCIGRTVDWKRHRMFVVSNGLCDESRIIAERMVYSYGDAWQLIDNGQNIGTARGINRAWEHRKPGENCLKVDSDVKIYEPGWLDKLEECIARDPQIGIIGLKRKDLAESPHNPPGQWSHSTLHMLPHVPGAPWLIVEKVNHVMGTCQLYNAALLEKIGYLVQMGAYGFDDSLAAVRCEVAGFYNCFYPHYSIDHPDPGQSQYQKWKERESGNRINKYFGYVQAYKAGMKSVYHGPSDDLD